MSFGQFLLIVVWFASFEVEPSACCDSYECNSFTTSNECTGRCAWANEVCREFVCGDFDSDSCTGFGDLFNLSCEMTGNSCVEISSCSQFSQNHCHGRSVGGSYCDWIGSACKAVTCADYASGTPDNCRHALVSGGVCKYSSTGPSCTLTTTCGEWSNDPDCGYLWFDEGSCFADGSTCRVVTCADGGQNNCTGIGDCKYTNGQCVAVTSCSSWDSWQDCEYHGSGGNLSCEWNDGTSTCAPKPACSTYNSNEENCVAASCYYLDSCPVESRDSSFGVVIPSLLVVLLLAFLL